MKTTVQYADGISQEWPGCSASVTEENDLWIVHDTEIVEEVSEGEWLNFMVVAELKEDE